MTRHCPTHRRPLVREHTSRKEFCIACRNEAKRARSAPEQKRAKSREGMRRLRAGREG